MRWGSGGEIRPVRKIYRCKNFPECRYTEKTAAEQKTDEENAGEVCDICGAPMIVKRGKFGAFLVVPTIRNARVSKRSRKKTGLTCPNAAKVKLSNARSKRAENFFRLQRLS